MIATHSRAGLRPAHVAEQFTWRGFSLGVLVGGLLVSMALAVLSPGARGRRADAPGTNLSLLLGRSDVPGLLRSFREASGLSAVEERQVRSVLADAQEARAAAIAYFAAASEGDGLAGNDADRGAAALTDQRAEVEEVVGGTIHQRLIELLGASRAALAEQHLAPLLAVASTNR